MLDRNVTRHSFWRTADIGEQSPVIGPSLVAFAYESRGSMEVISRCIGSAALDSVVLSLLVNVTSLSP